MSGISKIVQKKRRGLLGFPGRSFFLLGGNLGTSLEMKGVKNEKMGNKLVYINGKPFWFTPEGRFETAVQKNGFFVEHILLRTDRGLRELSNGKTIR